MEQFKITLYRGDTKKVTANLSVDGQVQDLTGYTATLYNQRTGEAVASATISKEIATFDINKELSSSLPNGYTALMLVFESKNQRVSQPGILCVQEGV